MDPEHIVKLAAALAQAAWAWPVAELFRMVREMYISQSWEYQVQLGQAADGPETKAHPLERVTGNMARPAAVVVEYRNDVGNYLDRMRIKLPPGLTMDDIEQVKRGLAAGCRFSRRGLADYISQEKYNILWRWLRDNRWIETVGTETYFKGQARGLLGLPRGLSPTD